MKKKMESVINISLETLEIYTNQILKNAKEDPDNYAKMERNLRTLNAIGSDMERIRRLQMQKALGNLDN